jgi:outer membrane protein assembly factor BamB
MSHDPIDTLPRRPLRVWPGIVLAALLVLVRYVLPSVAGDAMVGQLPMMMFGLFAALPLALGIILWWLFASRARWLERLGAIVLMIAAYFAVLPLLDPSMAGGIMGTMLFIYVVPVFAIALVAGAIVARGLDTGARRAVIAGAIVLAAGAWTLLRTGGITGDGERDFQLRWTQSSEERALAEARGTQTAQAPSSASADALAQTIAEWPGFRGPRRDGIVHGVRIATDWSASPPVELWRRPVGPAWSSFAVQGDLLYTQEQRGEEEVVACYRLSTGEPVWSHGDPVRFYDSEGGPGPRGTPTVHNGVVYTLGATGIVNALDAASGKRLWTRDIVADTGNEQQGWGFTSSPLVVDDVVVAAAGGRLVAYDLTTGEPRWVGPESKSGYSSPQLLTVAGEQQILLMCGKGATAVAPGDGGLLWEHKLPSGGRIVQPAMTEDGDLLISDGDYGDGNHMRRVAVTHDGSGFRTEERWSSTGLKPNFSDFVVHHGHAYGFDGPILSAIDLADGTRKWKGGRYGHGQLLLLADQDVLLVISEKGELALVSATPDRFTELARAPALHGKTWNHPVLVGDVLLVRNGEEMAAFRLAPA